MEEYMNDQINTSAHDIPRHTKTRIEKHFKRNLVSSLICPMVGCISLYFVPLVNFNGKPMQAISAYLIALLFWGSIIAEIVFSRRCRKTRRAMEYRLFKYKPLRYSYPGVISFFKNREATVADISLFVSAIFVAALLWLRVKVGWMILFGISLFFLSFSLHCLLNGRNYRYYKAYAKSREEHTNHE